MNECVCGHAAGEHAIDGTCKVLDCPCDALALVCAACNGGGYKEIATVRSAYWPVCAACNGTGVAK